MTPSSEDLAAQYAQMSETELMELAHSYDGLLEVAQSALRAEFARSDSSATGRGGLALRGVWRRVGGYGER